MERDEKNTNKPKVSKIRQKIISHCFLLVVLTFVWYLCIVVLLHYKILDEMHDSEILMIFLLTLGLFVAISIVLGVLLEKHFGFSKHYERLTWIIFGYVVGILVYRYFGLYLAFGVFVIFLILAIVGYPTHKR